MRATASRSRGENPGRASAESVTLRASANAASAMEHGASRPEAVAQRRLERLANQSAQARSTARHQSLLNTSPGVVALQRRQQLAGESPGRGGELKPEAAPARQPALEAQAGAMGARASQLGGLERAAFAPGAIPASHPTAPGAVIQAKFEWESNHRAAAHPDHLLPWQVDPAAGEIQAVVDGLADDATEADAQGGINQWFHAKQLQQQYAQQWVGRQLYLDDLTGTRIEFLGTLHEDHQDALYVPVADVPNLYIKKSDGSEWVRDGANHYTPRYLTRSIDAADIGTLRADDGLSAREPDGNGSALEHVSGLRRSQYASYTRSQNDVMNAHGAMFNAAGRGRAEIDLTQVARVDISDLSTAAGASAHLKPSLSAAGKEHFDEIIARAQQEAAAELARGPAVANQAAPAVTARPAAFNGWLTAQHWQAMVDIFRTQEVLVEGAVPQDAVVDYRDNAAAHAGAHIGAPMIADFKGANRAAADARTASGAQALATHRAAAPIAPLFQAQYPAARQAIDARLQARRNALLLPVVAGATRQQQDTRRRRNQALAPLLTQEKGRLRGSIADVAQSFQHRNDDGWPNSAPADFVTRIDQDALAGFAAIDLPA
jgi:hypothetical protein